MPVTQLDWQPADAASDGVIIIRHFYCRARYADLLEVVCLLNREALKQACAYVGITIEVKFHICFERFPARRFYYLFFA